MVFLPTLSASTTHIRWFLGRRLRKREPARKRGSTTIMFRCLGTYTVFGWRFDCLESSSVECTEPTGNPASKTCIDHVGWSLWLAPDVFGTSPIRRHRAV